MDMYFMGEIVFFVWIIFIIVENMKVLFLKVFEKKLWISLNY